MIIDKQIVGAEILAMILIGLITSYIVVGIEENNKIPDYVDGPGNGGILTINVYIRCLNDTIFLIKSYSEKFTNLKGEVKLSDLSTLVSLTFIISVRNNNFTQTFEENLVIGFGNDIITLSISG